DRLDALALGFQRLDLLKAGRGTSDQAGVVPAVGMRLLGRRDQIRARRSGRHLRRYLMLTQATVVGGDGLLDLLGQVVPQVPPVGDLRRVRSASPGAFG